MCGSRPASPLFALSPFPVVCCPACVLLTPLFARFCLSQRCPDPPPSLVLWRDILSSSFQHTHPCSTPRQKNTPVKCDPTHQRVRAQPLTPQKRVSASAAPLQPYVLWCAFALLHPLDPPKTAALTAALLLSLSPLAGGARAGEGRWRAQSGARLAGWVLSPFPPPSQSAQSHDGGGSVMGQGLLSGELKLNSARARLFCLASRPPRSGFRPFSGCL